MLRIIIWIIYHFNQAKGMDNIIIPPESYHKFGLFATRSPRRPNPVGLSLIKLDSIKNNKLFVSYYVKGEYHDKCKKMEK